MTLPLAATPAKSLQFQPPLALPLKLNPLCGCLLSLKPGEMVFAFPEATARYLFGKGR